MKNKVLVKLIVPEINNSFDLYIPVNEILWKIIKLTVKSVSDLTNGDLDIQKEYILINKDTGVTYDCNSIVYNTDIRNATELILLTVKENNVNQVAFAQE